MSDQRELLQRHKKVMPSWVALYYEEPIALVRGEGRHVWDAEGTRYLDFFGGILTTISGHCVPEVVEAIREQAGRMVHSSTAYLIEPAVHLAEEIARLAPMPESKVFFVSSGSEANETALMLATGFRRSNQILALRNSYHGRSFASMAVTGNRGWGASSLTPFKVSYVHGGYRYRSPFRDFDDADYITACADDLRNVIETTTAGGVACLIAEPIQGVGGFATPPDGFFAAMKKVLDEYDILFVSDEVQTGWGRTGETFWGIEAHGVTPDIVTFAKGIGNGLAIGGVIARPDIMDSVSANSIATFGGNHLSTVGSLANLRYLLDNNLQQNALNVGGRLLAKLRTLQQQIPRIGEVRGKGLMIGIEVVRPGSREPDAPAAARLMEECKRRGLLLGRGGLYSNVLRIAPPLSVTPDEGEEGFAIVAAAFEALSENES